MFVSKHKQTIKTLFMFLPEPFCKTTDEFVNQLTSLDLKRGFSEILQFVQLIVQK